VSSYELRIERISLRQLVAFSPTPPPPPWTDLRSSGHTFASLAPDGTPLAGFPIEPSRSGAPSNGATPYGCELRDAVIGEYVAQAASAAARGRLVSSGVPLSGLRRAVWPQVRRYPGRVQDIEAEALAALEAAVAQCEASRVRLAVPLGWLDRKGTVGWIHTRRMASSDYSALEFVGNSTTTPCSYGGGHARQGWSIGPATGQSAIRHPRPGGERAQRR